MSASPLFDKINADLITAMKAKDEASTSALRMLKSALKYKEVDLKRELKDEDVIDVLSKQAKQRKESIEGFEKGGRSDMADKEKAELALIEKFLPAGLSDDELAKLIAEAIQSSGAAGPKDMGKVMGVLTPKIKGRADMGKVSGMVKAKLG
ncbi:MAG TPA: GatB/YqeY domain-containing protein [bacterium]|nr:GatB/YqeY domain-containing protein [bacterium]